MWETLPPPEPSLSRNRHSGRISVSAEASGQPQGRLRSPLLEPVPLGALAHAGPHPGPPFLLPLAGSCPPCRAPSHEASPAHWAASALPPAGHPELPVQASVAISTSCQGIKCVLVLPVPHLRPPVPGGQGRGLIRGSRPCLARVALDSGRGLGMDGSEMVTVSPAGQGMTDCHWTEKQYVWL